MKHLSLSLASIALCTLAYVGCSDDSSGNSVIVDTGDESGLDVSSSAAMSSGKVTSERSSSSVKSRGSSVDDSGDVSSSSATSLGVSSTVSDERSSSSAKSDNSDENLDASSSSAVMESSSSAEEEGFFNGNWREDCLAKINEYRATENLDPLVLAPEEKQTCADEQSAADLASGVAHGHFGDCGEFAQNSGPNFSANFRKNASAVAEYYLKMMWEDEKELVVSGERDPDNNNDYPYIGHYLNMKNTSYTKVACGMVLSADGKKGWFNVNFY